MQFSTTTEIDFGLESDEIINISLLSEAILVSAIFFTVSIFYYTKTSQHNALQFNCCYKILSIMLVFMSFFLIITAITYRQKTSSNVHIGATIVLSCLLIAIIISNIIGSMDYRYRCWDKWCPKLAQFHPNNCCKIILYFLVLFVIIFLFSISFNKNPGQNIENILLITFFLSVILSICNGISLMIASSIIFCLFCGFLWMDNKQTMDEQHINKFFVYSFPIIFTICLLYGIICCRNTKTNKIYFRQHVGYNVLCALLSILNRATNVIVFFIWISSKTSAGWMAVFQLFLIIMTATISTISVQFNPQNHNNDNNDNAKLKKYFCFGKFFTFIGWGRIYFEMATWDRNIQRDSIMNGYHSIKIYELIFECFPSLALQIIVSIQIFVHETVTVSIIVTIIYITIIVIHVMYDETHSVNTETKETVYIAATSTIPAPCTSIQVSSGMMNEIELATPANMTTSGGIITSDGAVTTTDDGQYGSVHTLDVDITNNNNNNSECMKSCCYVFGSVLFVWTDFFMRIIPLWLLTKIGGIVVIYIILLLVIDIILYWRMIVKGGGNKLNKCLDIILFGWTGIVTATYYGLSTKGIKYISSVVDDRILCIEYWIRITLNIIVFIGAEKQLTPILGLLFVVGTIFNIISGYKLYFRCCCKNKEEQQVMQQV